MTSLSTSLATCYRILTMPDSFFAAKSRKRKRSSKTNEAGPSKPTKTPRRTGGRETASGRSKLNGAPNGKRRHVDEELESDITGDEDAGDMDLRAVSESEGSGEEDETETPAQKRLRLAKLYLASVKENLGKPSLIFRSIYLCV